MFKNKNVRHLAQLVISLALLAGLLWFVGFEEVIATLTSINWRWYVPAFAMFLVNVVIRAYRWYILLRVLNDRPSFGHLVYLYFLGFFTNNFIPSSMGGEVVKVLSLRSTHGKGTEALSSVLMERLTGLLGSAVIALFALIWNAISHTTNVELPPVLWGAIVLLSMGIPLGFVLVRWTAVIAWGIGRFPIVRRIPRFEKFEQLVSTVRLYPLGILLQALLISLPFTISLILVQYSIARAFGVHLSLAIFSLFVPIIAILMLLPLSFNGLGLREGLYLLLFIPVGVSHETAIAMSLAFSFLRTAAGLIGGLLYAMQSVGQMVKTQEKVIR